MASIAFQAPDRQTVRRFHGTAARISCIWRTVFRSGHATWHETADRNSERPLDRPNHGSAGAVRLGYDGVIGHDNPFTVQADTIVPFLGIPIRICNRDSVGNRATGPLPAS